MSDRIAVLKAEMAELKAANRQYWAQSRRSAFDNTAQALRRDRLLAIKEELADTMKRLHQAS